MLFVFWLNLLQVGFDLVAPNFNFSKVIFERLRYKLMVQDEVIFWSYSCVGELLLWKVGYWLIVLISVENEEFGEVILDFGHNEDLRILALFILKLECVFVSKTFRARLETDGFSCLGG